MAVRIDVFLGVPVDDPTPVTQSVRGQQVALQYGKRGDPSPESVSRAHTNTKVRRFPECDDEEPSRSKAGEF